MKRTPLRRVSKKRAKQLRTYTDVRKEYLKEHPWCVVCVKEFSIKHQDFYNDVEYNGPISSNLETVRKATQIHHVCKRRGDKLNDTSKFLPVCARCHTWIERHLNLAREDKRLYVQDHLRISL